MDDNLKELLGFDPESEDRSHESSGEMTPLKRLSEISGVKEDTLRAAFLEKVKPGIGSAHKDPDNLFTVDRSETFGVGRKYYRLKGNSDSPNFMSNITTSMENPYSVSIVSTEYEEENRGHSSISFLKDGRVNLYKLIDNSRIINCFYNPDGEFSSIDFTVMGDHKNDASLGLEGMQKAQRIMPGNVYDFAGGTRMDAKKSADGKNWEVIFKKGEEVTDEFQIPLSLGKTAQALMEDIYPDELLRNPTNPDVRLDESAKLDPFTRVGIKWQVFTPEGEIPPTTRPNFLKYMEMNHTSLLDDKKNQE